MKDTIIDILKKEKFLKVIELALAVWAKQNNRELSGIWQPTNEEYEQILEVERTLLLFLPQMKRDGIVDIDPDYKHVRLGEGN